MKAFITGSHAYGLPTEDSDIDLVIRVDEATKNFLKKYSDIEEGLIIRFGNLNIVAITSDKEFVAWKFGTEQLVNKVHKVDNKKSFLEKEYVDKHEASNLFKDLLVSIGCRTVDGVSK